MAGLPVTIEFVLNFKMRNLFIKDKVDMKTRIVSRFQDLNRNTPYVFVFNANLSFVKEAICRLRSYVSVAGVLLIGGEVSIQELETVTVSKARQMTHEGVLLLAIPELTSDLSFLNQTLHNQGMSDYYILNPLFWMGKRAIYEPTHTRMDDVIGALTFEEDRALFRQIMTIRGNKTNDVLGAYTAIMKKMYSGGRRYVEYLNTRLIKTILCGGIGVAGPDYFPYLSRNHFPKMKRIVAFDPDQSIFEYSYSNTYLESQNSCLEIVPKALAEKEQLLPFDNCSKISFCGSGRVKHESDQFVQATTIDNFVEENKFFPDLIQLTIMNYEYLALQGGETTICEHRPQIVFYGFWNPLLYLYDILEDYIFRFGLYTEGMGYLIFYAIPKEKYFQ
jgi:FkbM family methyltransferase